MKEIKQVSVKLIMSAIIAMFLLNSCGGSGIVDIPEYAKENGKPYFNTFDKNQTVFTGKVSKVSGRSVNRGKMGDLSTFAKGGQAYYTQIVELGETPVNLIFYGSYFSISEFTKSDKYSIQALIEKPNDKEYDGPSFLWGEELKTYSKGFYFFEDEQYKQALEYLSNLQKSENKPSKFADSEFRTFNSKIGKAVYYTGFDFLGERKDFQSLYLECGAVVQLFDKNVINKNLEGKNIDCSISTSNDVLDFEIN